MHVDFAANTLMEVLLLGHILHVWSLHGFSYPFIDIYMFMNLRACFSSLYGQLWTFFAYVSALRQLNTR
jgi:hypothetical protein